MRLFVRRLHRNACCAQCVIIAQHFRKEIQTNSTSKDEKTKSKNIDFDVFVVRDREGRFLLEKRPEEGLLANMWQFPMVERQGETLKTLAQNYQLTVDLFSVPVLKFMHVFSHLTWQVESHLVDLIAVSQLPDNARFFSKAEIAELPMPVPMLKIWDKLK